MYHRGLHTQGRGGLAIGNTGNNPEQPVQFRPKTGRWSKSKKKKLMIRDRLLSCSRTLCVCVCVCDRNNPHGVIETHIQKQSIQQGARSS